MNVSIDKPTYAENFLTISMSFYYAVGVIWTGSILNKTQQVQMWAISVLLVLLALASVAKGKISFSTRPSLYIVSLSSFLFFSWASYFWAESTDRVISRGGLITRIILSMMVFSLLLNSPKGLRTILKSIEYGGYMAVCYLIFQNGASYMLSRMLRGSRLKYTGINSNTIGLVAAFSVIIAVYFLTVEGFKVSTLFVIPSAFIIVLSVSKKSFAAVILGIVLYRMFYTMKKNKIADNIIRTVGILCLMAVSVYLLLKLPIMASIVKRMEGLFNGFFGGDNGTTVDTSTSQRMYLKQMGFDLIKQNPLLGVGLDCARYFNKYKMYLHDNYLEIFSDLGLVGFVSYYAVYFIVAVRFIKNWNTEDKEFDICFTLLFLMLILDYSRVSYYNLSTYYIILLFCIKSGALVKERMEKERNKKALGETICDDADK